MRCMSVVKQREVIGCYADGRKRLVAVSIVRGDRFYVDREGVEHHQGRLLTRQRTNVLGCVGWFLSFWDGSSHFGVVLSFWGGSSHFGVVLYLVESSYFR